MFTTIQLKLHNPSTKKKILLDSVFHQYTNACREGLIVLQRNYVKLQDAVTFTTDARKIRISTEQRISKYIRPILQAEVLNEFSLSGALNDSAIKWISSNIKSHFELKMKFPDEPEKVIYPAIPTPTEIDEDFKQTLKALTESKTFEEEREAKHKFLRFTFRERLLPISFVRARDCKLFKTENGKYFVQLPTLAAEKSGPYLSNSSKLFKGKHSKTDLTFPLSFGDFQQDYLEDGESVVRAAQLIKKENDYYLHLSLELPDKTEGIVPEKVLGIDLGITDTCTFSLLNFDGVVEQQDSYNGAERKKQLREFKELLRTEQVKGRSTAGITMTNLSKHMVHDVVNDILKIAEAHHSLLVLEDLTKIRQNQPNNKYYRTLFASWDFGRFKEILSYKAERKGIPVVFIWSSYSSQTCSRCGATNKDKAKWIGEFLLGDQINVDKIKRLKNIELKKNGNNIGSSSTQRPIERFGENLKMIRCHCCGYTSDADVNASVVIAQRGMKQYIEFKKRKEQRSLTQ